MMVTTLLLVVGAMTMTWICDKITDSGFGIYLLILAFSEYLPVLFVYRKYSHSQLIVQSYFCPM